MASLDEKLAPVAPIDGPSGGWQLIYGGKWQESTSGSRLDTYSPIDNSVIASIPNASAGDVDLAVQSATQAAKDWARTTPSERVAALEALSGRLLAASEKLAWLDAVNGGLPISACRREVAYGASRVSAPAHLAAQIKGETFAEAHGLWGFTRREPYGVVASILAFNHPILFFMLDVGPALAAGNSIIVKPAETVSLSALAMGEIAQDVLPPGLLNVITGDGPGTGNAISKHPGIPRIKFTGSVQSGQAVMMAASTGIKHVQLELGGKNPLVILPDADLDLAARMAVDGMNLRGVGGQSCQSCSRVLIHDSRYDEFVELLLKAVENVRVGDPRDDATEMGAMAFRKHFERVTRYIQIGIDEGATLLAGGETPPGLEGGNFVAPTVFGDVTPAMRIAREEIFGPVISLMRWHERDDMVELANAGDYGLTARIACGSLGDGLQLANELQAGLIWINEATGTPEGLPFGGYKSSGLGKQHSFEALLSYTQEKAINVRY